MSAQLTLGSKLAITYLLESWINHYHQFCPESMEAKEGRREPLTIEEVVERINGGDCGTTAIAVGYVFNELLAQYSSQTDDFVKPAEFYDNYNHAFLKVNERFYDTFNVAGVDSASLMFEADAPNASVENVGLAELFKRYIHKDRTGARLIETFCQRWYVSVEPRSKALLDDTTAGVSAFTQRWYDYVALVLSGVPAFRSEPVTHTDAAEVIDPEAPNEDLNDALTALGIKP